jgi:N-acetylmuramoyl-L-alanine amidase
MIASIVYKIFSGRDFKNKLLQPTFIFFLICFLFQSLNSLSQSPQRPTYSIKKVIIDPGHGGRDPGAIVGNVKEKDIVLAISKKLGNYIKQNMPDVEVVYTRNGDSFTPLYKRATIAIRNNADLFISIHANTCPSPSINGTETYILGNHRSEDNLDVAKKENSVILFEEDYTTRYEGFDPNLSESYIMFELVQAAFWDQSLLFASMVQNQFKERAHRIDKDIRQAGFLVLRETSMPSVLIETGYMSNKKECRYLLTKNGQNVIASAIFRAFREYKEIIETRSNYQSSIKEEENTHLIVSKPDIVLDKGIVFAVQIAATKSKLELLPDNFRGLNELYIIKADKLYKYLSGASISYEVARKKLRIIKNKYPDAFLTAFENGNPLNIKMAIKKAKIKN